MLDLQMRNVRRTRRIFFQRLSLVAVAVVVLFAGGILTRQFLIREDAEPSAMAAPPSPSPSAIVAVAPTATASFAPQSAPPSMALSASPSPTATPMPPGHRVEDGFWEYWDEDATIQIERVSGEAINGVYTAYVADIHLKDPSRIQTLFAMDKVGRNYREYTHEMAVRSQAIVAINGDYYGYRDTGIIVRNGVLYRNEPVNEGLAIYRDGRMDVFDENDFDVEAALADGLLHTYAFGPGLVMDGEKPEAYRSPVSKSNPRTAVGMRAPGEYVFVVVDGRERGYSGGMTMDELGQFMLDLGCTEAYNFDGGATSEMCFMGEVVNKPSNGGRETSDILYIASYGSEQIQPEE